MAQPFSMQIAGRKYMFEIMRKVMLNIVDAKTNVNVNYNTTNGRTCSVL